MNRISSIAALASLLLLGQPVAHAAAELPTVAARAASGAAASGFDAVVEAVRQTVVAAQVSGAVVQLDVKAGDRVQAGQVLLRLDARTADQAAAASDAQVEAARAALDVATKELERQRQLYKQNFISAGAFDRAESEFKATQAQVNAQLAQAGAARTQTGLHVVRAPYAGVVSEVPVALGDMALPGRPLVTVYDPAALRVTASVPQTVASQMPAGSVPRIEVPGLAGASPWIVPQRVQVLPTVDPATHTVELRADLPPGTAGVVPGSFARVWIPLGGAASASPTVPVRAVVRRAEMTGLYVLDGSGRPLLRQVRLGRSDGDSVEVLAGLAAGERVVTEPQAAARAR
jgi:RND family efflux transporter MFP subunit